MFWFSHWQCVLEDGFKDNCVLKKYINGGVYCEGVALSLDEAFHQI